MSPLLKDWSFLLLTPNGRASVGPYLVGGAIMRLVSGWATIGLSRCGEDDPSGLYAAPAMTAIWMWYCIASRRMHDTGKGSGVLTLLMLAEMGFMLCLLDPAWIVKRDNPEETLATIWSIDRLLNLIVAAYGVYLHRVPSDHGDNAYGAPSGEARNGGWKYAVSGVSGVQTSGNAIRGPQMVARMAASTIAPAANTAARSDSSRLRKSFSQR